MDQSGSEPQVAALARAEALVDATVGSSPAECLALANQIAELRRLHDTPAIAFAQATALVNASTDPNTAGERCREFEHASELTWSAYELRPTLRTRVELPLPAAWAAAVRRITDNTAHPDSAMLDRSPYPPSGS
ncbi:MAG: hypothetical protein NXI31_13480 [bacterium]|nr:hypothetical protein [bacterium]